MLLSHAGLFGVACAALTVDGRREQGYAGVPSSFRRPVPADVASRDVGIVVSKKEASNGPPRGRHLGDVGYPLLKFTAKLNYHWVGGREEKTTSMLCSNLGRQPKWHKATTRFKWTLECGMPHRTQMFDQTVKHSKRSDAMHTQTVKQIPTVIHQVQLDSQSQKRPSCSKRVDTSRPEHKLTDDTSNTQPFATVPRATNASSTKRQTRVTLRTQRASENVNNLLI